MEDEINNPSDFFTETAFLATRDKIDDRVLLCNRIDSNDNSGDFYFYLIEILSPSQSHLAQKIAQILTNGAKTTIGLSPDNFETSLSLINETLERLSNKENNDWIGNINAVIGLVQGKEIFLSQTGNIVGYIFRKNRISSLTEQSDDNSSHPGRTFTEIISGQISIGDQVVFTNNSLFNAVSIDRLRTLVKTENARAEILDLKCYLQKIHHTKANAIFIQVNNKKTENDLEEMLYLDEAEETAFSNFCKDLSPKLKKTQKNLSVFWSKTSKRTQEIYQQLRESWQTKYRPKTKKFFGASGEKIHKGLQKGQKSILEFSSNKSGQIKTNQYHKQNKNQKLSNFFSEIIPFSVKNKKVLILLLVVVVILISYVKIKNNNIHKNEIAKEIEINSAYDQAKSLYDQAKSDLDSGKSTDLTKFYDALALAEKSKSAGNNVDKANTLIGQINDILDDKTKTVRFTNSSNFTLAEKTTKIVLVGSDIYGLTEEGKFYKADVRDQSPKLIASAGQENGNVITLTYSSGLNAILMITDSNKLLSFDISSSTLGKLTNSESNTDWKASKAIATYSTNIYALDQSNAAIWKYTQLDSGYGKASTYVDTKKVSLTNSVDMAIDGNIYVLKSDGSVIKLVKGALESDFAIKDIPDPKNKVEQPAQIFTSEDTNSIFVLDKTNNRIIKFDKSGSFTNQYVFDGVTVESFVVNAKLQKIWALSGGKIYEGNL